MNRQDILVDSYGRRVSYLRISLTDLCNFRCVYCLPEEGVPVTPPSNYLTRDEIMRFVKIMGRLGVHRIRLTGGEPLLRDDVLDIVKSLKSIETVRDLSLTTNASHLGPLVQPLKEAGLDRINISLDSLDPERFKEITLTDFYYQVLDATFLALRAGFPVKLNMVVLKGISDTEIEEFAKMAYDFPLDVRFLEFMPLCGTGWKPEWVLPIDHVRKVIHKRFELTEEKNREDDVAQNYLIHGGKGKIGLIASLTESFCDACSRIRLSADGNIHPCLFSDKEVSVKELLRNKATDEAIIEAIRHAVSIKPKGNWFHENKFNEKDSPVELLQANPMIRSIGG